MRHVVIVPASFFLLSFVLRMSPAASEAVKVKDVLGNEEAKARRGKVFSFFQVVSFPNDNCNGGARNGTCYTSNECSTRGGTNMGSCAEGFGVCCVFTLKCGETSSENTTYLVSSGDDTDRCLYTICKAQSDICRIRLDFNVFQISPPEVGTTSETGAAENVGGAIGDCVGDSFTFSAPGVVGSPVICGYNTAQHMIIDASDGCHKAYFALSPGASADRQWDIAVTQYRCGQEGLGGPQGCLQYFTGTTGVISSFNFPTQAEEIPDTATHLSNQKYTVCVRREGKCSSICYKTYKAGVASMPTNQASFGLSISPAAGAAKSAVGTSCAEDYIRILTPQAAGTMVDRLCGRFFDAEDAQAPAAPVTVCSQVTPFRLGVHFDGDEQAASAGDADDQEQAMAPGGIVGFSLEYEQIGC